MDIFSLSKEARSKANKISYDYTDGDYGYTYINLKKASTDSSTGYSSTASAALKAVVEKGGNTFTGSFTSSGTYYAANIHNKVISYFSISSITYMNHSSDITCWDLESDRISQKSYATQTNVSFYSDASSMMSSTCGYIGDAVFKPADPAKAYNIFAGWDKEVPATINGTNTAITAQWELINYSITYNLDGGTNNESNPNSYTVESEDITLSEPTKENYRFTGWTDQDGNELTTIVKGSHENLILTAHWVITKHTNTYVDGFGNTIATITEEIGSSVTAPTMDGHYDSEGAYYTFAGWDKSGYDTIGDSDTTYTATWSNKITYTFSGNTLTGVTDKTITAAIIPSKTPTGEEVTAIGSYAFSGCSSLTSITIPNSVTSIGEWAFFCCSSLSSIAIPDTVTSIGSNAFYGCSSLTSIIIPDSVTSIGYWAFCGCSSLKSITLGNSVTSISSYAFYGCSSLSSINIPDSVTSIGTEAFSWCSSLSSITIPDSVTSIGSKAFYNCSSLSSITIPDSVTSIGSGAFYNCSSLTSITIPDSVTSIGSGAFEGCSSLQYNSYDNAYYLGNSNNPYLVLVKAKDTSITSCEINSNCKIICGSAFQNRSKLSSITIPDSVTYIGKWAFYNCSSLSSITIPDSVTSIGFRAFYGCSSLTIYCKASSRPSGWDSDWNPDNRTVVWNSAIV